MVMVTLTLAGVWYGWLRLWSGSIWPVTLAHSAFNNLMEGAAVVNGDKKVLLAAPRGYCAGVDRAVVAVEKALEHHGAPVYVRKEIVHNRHVVETLEQQGVVFVEELDEVPEGSLTVFSAHGVSPAVVNEAADRNLKTIEKAERKQQAGSDFAADQLKLVSKAKRPAHGS